MLCCEVMDTKFTAGAWTRWMPASILAPVFGWSLNNAPVEMEKRIKYNDLVANALIVLNVVDMTCPIELPSSRI